ncbi:MAG: long-chain fatty acid transport protein, partial [uncultured bacterium]
LTNQLTGWGYGYNAGVLVQFTPETRMGLSYRSPITVKATGPSELGLNTSTVSANFPLPATTMLSVYHDVNHRLAVMASAFYTQWSCFNQLIIKNMAQNSGTATAVINENYRNTWNLAVGSRYKFNQHIALEAGFGHDQTPTQLPYRDIRLPDNNRYVASVGINIHPRKDFEWSMGWTHLFTRDTLVDNSGSLSNQSTVPAANFAIGKGTVHSSVNVFGIQFTWDV